MYIVIVILLLINIGISLYTLQKLTGRRKLRFFKKKNSYKEGDLFPEVDITDKGSKVEYRF